MGWRPQADILEPIAEESLRAETQTGFHLIESNLDVQQVGHLATRLDHVLYPLWERYGRGHATDSRRDWRNFPGRRWHPCAVTGTNKAVIGSARDPGP
jgi:hypothetical protein